MKRCASVKRIFSSRNNDMNETLKAAMERIVNRHMARLLAQLQEINAPQLIIEAVKTKMIWLRNDLGDEVQSHE